MKFFLVGASILSLVQGISISEDAKRLHAIWKDQYGIVYKNEEHERERQVIFAKNLDYIINHNEKFSRGEVTFDMALNKHADMSFEEWNDMLLAFKKKKNEVPHSREEGHLGEHSVPLLRVEAKSVDWRLKGAVGPVKDQGQCGSCWSFSSTGAIEGAHAISTGSLVTLSEEQLINCVDGGQFDCNTGGDMVEAFKYVIKNKGIVSESSDPYVAKDHLKCKYNPAVSTDASGILELNDQFTTNYVATISGYKTIPTNNEDALKSALNLQPVSIAIDASHQSFQFYHSGVYSDEACCTNCSESDLDHGVLAIGYGTEKGNDYWLVKNSWAAGWGDAGYIKIIRGDSGRCGVPTMASYPVV